MTFALVLFDFDGTLADSLPWFGQAIQRVADEFGFRRLSPEEMDKLRDRNPATILSGLGIPIWKMPRIAAAMRRMMADHLDEIRLFEGIEEFLLQTAATGLRLGIVSSNSESNVRGVLGPDNAGHFSHYECGVSLLGKASRLRRVARAAGVPVERTLYIGDELRDLDAAEKVGMSFGAVTWGCARPAAFAERRPHTLFATIAELQHYLTGR